MHCLAVVLDLGLEALNEGMDRCDAALVTRGCLSVDSPDLENGLGYDFEDDPEDDPEDGLERDFLMSAWVW